MFNEVIDGGQTIMKKKYKFSPKINGFQPIVFKQNEEHFKKD